MDRFAWLLVVLAAVVIFGLGALVLLSESCEEQGGHNVFSHMQYTPMGKSFTLVPIYRCDIPNK